MTDKHTVSLTLLLLTITSLAVCTTVLAKDKLDLDISGYVMLDYDDFDRGLTEDDSASTRKSDVRRARLNFKADLLDNWNAKLQLGFAGDSTEIKDAYIQYKGWSWADLKIGEQKEPFGLEKLTSSRNLLMIERSLVSQALSPGRSMGVSLGGNYSGINWQLGYFHPDESESASAITGRFTWLPWQEGDNLLHLGAAFSERDLENSDFRINARMEVYYSDSIVEGEKLIADSNSLQSIELMWQMNGITTMAEWQQAEVTDHNDIDYDYKGGYVQIGYQLNGQNRQYKNGTLGNTRDSGWEVTSRYSHFKLNEENQESDIYALGVNYFASKKLKFMADYINAEQTIKGIELDKNDAISLRVQYSF